MKSRVLALLAAAMVVWSAPAGAASVDFDVNADRSRLFLCDPTGGFGETPVLAVDGTFSVDLDDEWPVPLFGQKPFSVSNINWTGAQQGGQCIFLDNAVITSSAGPFTGNVEGLAGTDTAIADLLNFRVELDFTWNFLFCLGGLTLPINTFFTESDPAELPDLEMTLANTVGGDCTLADACELTNDDGAPFPSASQLQSACVNDTLCGPDDFCLPLSVDVAEIGQLDLLIKIVLDAAATNLPDATGRITALDDGTGALSLWPMVGATIQKQEVIFGLPGGWEFMFHADLNADGEQDLVVRDVANNALVGFLIVDNAIADAAYMIGVPAGFEILGPSDANGDGIADPYNPADAVYAAARWR